MNNSKAGISLPRDIHTQMLLNIVVAGVVLHTVYNRAEAARWMKEEISMVSHLPQQVLESRIKNGFRAGKRVAQIVDDVRVVKTRRVSPWRGREYHVPGHGLTPAQSRKARLAWAYDDRVAKTTTWQWRGQNAARAMC